MTSILKALIALLIGFGAYGVAQAAAEYRPDYCAVDHDHRSHNANYYDYYPADEYSRAGGYRSERARRFDSYGGRYDRRGGRYDDGYGGRYDRQYPRSRVVSRDHFQTRWRARITVVEEIYWTRSGRRQLVCSVLVRGPEAYYVPERVVRSVAHRECSSRARIQYI